ncbi:hypothetical protein ACT4XR_20065 (plasmid) [Acinetobacter baumannii]|uniref:hypothetical protein n=1 Tax=Acinetobacter baumannii TaxID=470 RepID=UPI003891C6F9
MSTFPYPNIYEDGCFAGAAEMNWLKPIFEKQIYVKFKKIVSFPFFLEKVKSGYYCEVDISEIEKDDLYIVYINYGETKHYDQETQYSLVLKVKATNGQYSEYIEGCSLRGDQLPIESINYSLRAIFDFN